MNDLTPKRGRAVAAPFDAQAELAAMGPAALAALRQEIEAGDPDALRTWAALTIPRPVRTVAIPEMLFPGCEVAGVMAALAVGRITASEAQEYFKVLAQRDALLALAARHGLGASPRDAAQGIVAGMVEGRVPPGTAREALAAIREAQEVEMAAVEQDLISAQAAAGDGAQGEDGE